MASNNLRIIYQNLADVGTTNIYPSSTASSATPVSNIIKDTKSLVWRSGTSSSSSSIKANLLVTFPTSLVGAVVLPFCNLSVSATIRVRCFTGNTPVLGGTVDSPTVSTAGATTVSDITVNACPYQVLGLWNWGAVPLGVNGYSYGGGTYGRVWLPSIVSCTSVVIEIVDDRSSQTSPEMYIEASRLILGSYWSPKYNTSFGLSNTIKDQSTHTRSDSGDLITNRSTISNSISFDMQYMNPSDRLELNRVLKGNGMSRPIFISLFPDNSEDWAKEQAHQIYGKLPDIPTITHPVYGIYSATINMEEI